MVSLVGERGYDETTVESLLERAEVSREAFDREFESKEECFVQLYDEVVRQLGKEALAGYGGATRWHDKIWAAGWSAMRFLAADADRARFLVVEVVSAGAGAQARRDIALQQFADLLDAGRFELGDPESVGRSTAEFVAGSIYRTLFTRVKDGWPNGSADFKFLPELMYMAVMPYLGSQAAEEQLRVQPLR